MSSRILKVAVIGVGGIARTHMPGWAASTEAEVVAGCDLVEPVLKKWGREHAIKRLAADAADIFSDRDIDLVDICTPNRHHAPLSIAALEAGKHVLCEKPLAPTPGGVRQMIAARDKSGKMLMTAQHLRFSGSARALKAEIDAGALGDVYHARSWILRRAGLSPKPGFILKEHSGGGPCIDIGVHILDLAQWMMGNPKPVVVTGVARNEIARQKGSFTNWSGAPIPPEMDVEDFAAAFVRYDNGATLVLEVSWFLHHDTKSEDMQMWLYGTRGGSHWPRCEIYDTNYTTRQFYNRRLQMTADRLEPHAQQCVEFAQAIVRDAPSPVPAEQSLQVMAVLDGLYRSQEQSGEVRLNGA